ncbi:hypothetical protein D9M68_386220 [compost metagenome]
MLEHHGQAGTQALQFIGVGHAHAVAVMDHFDRLVVQAHGAVVGRFQEVDATQKGAFARATGADQADHIAGFGIERNTLEDFMIAVTFVQVFNGQFVHEQAS